MITGIRINDMDITFNFFPAVVVDGTCVNVVDDCLGSVYAVYDGSEYVVDVVDEVAGVADEAGVVVEAEMVVADEPAKVHAVVNVVEDVETYVGSAMMQSTVEFVEPAPVELVALVVPAVLVVLAVLAALDEIGNCCLVRDYIGTNETI